nr:VCBS domain-containing protein [Bradyrhizobium manausense]
MVSTGSDSTLGVTFIDGTVFGLSSNARMVLNEMVYDPNGSNNSSLLSLVAGTITFVAGETAKHGDMKIDTPVATMGIRGTAVLTEINFIVPSGGGDPQPQANFQVLVEPNGTTGSYILFDKLTLLPIATVNQAGQMIQISGGNVSVTNALLSPDVQKLITDVFTLKFTDNGTNTKLTTNFTDSISQTGNIVTITTPDGTKAQATFTNTVNVGGGPGQGGGQGGGQGIDRIPGAPKASSLDSHGNVTSKFSLTEQADATADRSYKIGHVGEAVGPDSVSGQITFLDFNLGDRPTVSVDLAGAPNYVYQDAGQHDVTASLTALQKQDIAATEIKLSVVADGGNANNGSAVWTYKVPDHAFDFLAAGEKLTLTYIVSVDNNFSVNRETNTFPITITITGTNDEPVITTSVPTITFAGGTSTQGGSLKSEVPTSGTLTFTDVDLTDTHTVSLFDFSAALPDGTVPESIYKFLKGALLLSIDSGHDSTGTGTGSVTWSLKQIPVYLADFIPQGEVLTLTYTVRVTDSQGATSDQTITVTITGTDAPAVVWIATSQPGGPSGGFWKDGVNWETGNAPTSSDDVIVITDQLVGLTPSYPVTIDEAAFAKSLTMNNFDTTQGHTVPEVINKSTLTINQTLTLKADSLLTNLAAGVISVGGAAEFLETSVLANSGYLTLAGGGKFDVGTSITNSGTIELSGGTLTTLTEIHNAGGIIKVDAGALTKLIVNAATIDGGTVTILGTLELDGTSLIENGALNNSGAVKVEGAVEFANETVSNEPGGTIEVFADDVLKLDQGSSVSNQGHINVDTNGTLRVDDATIDGGGSVVEAGAPHTVHAGSDGGAVTISGVLELAYSSVLKNGSLDIQASGKFLSTGTNILENEVATSNGMIEVKDGSLTFDASSSITTTGTFEVDGGSLVILGTFSGVATIVGSSLMELGSASSSAYASASVVFEAESSGVLQLDYSTSFGGTIVGLDDNRLDLVDFGSSGVHLSYSGTLSDGVLTITDGTNTAHAAHLHLSGDYQGSSWAVTEDGHGGIYVTEAAGKLVGVDTSGNAVEGRGLQALVTDGGRAVTDVHYQWQLDGHDIQGAIGATYVPTALDEGGHLSVSISFTDYLNHPETSVIAAGVVQEDSTENASIELDGLVSNRPIEGEQIVAIVTDSDAPSSGIRYTWTVDGKIVHAGIDDQGQIYTPAHQDGGGVLAVAVSFVDTHGFQESGTLAAGTVQAEPGVIDVSSPGDHTLATGSSFERIHLSNIGHDTIDVGSGGVQVAIHNDGQATFVLAAGVSANGSNFIYLDGAGLPASEDPSPNQRGSFIFRGFDQATTTITVTDLAIDHGSNQHQKVAVADATGHDLFFYVAVNSGADGHFHLLTHDNFMIQ